MFLSKLIVYVNYFGDFEQEEFSVEEQEAVQQALRQRLGPEFISQRVGAGGLKVGSVTIISFTFLIS